jgi:hypothetical protein
MNWSEFLAAIVNNFINHRTLRSKICVLIIGLIAWIITSAIAQGDCAMLDNLA